MASLALSLGVQGGLTGLSFLTSIFTAHKKKVAQEANTLNGAVPAWRQEILTTVETFNAGQIDSSTAVGYIEQAKSLYYQQVQSIRKGKPPAGGIGVDEYQSTETFPRLAKGIDPCNAACFIADYYIEPEATLVETALQSGSGTFQLREIDIRNGDSVPSQTVTVTAPPLEKILPASVYSQIPQTVREHPVEWGVGAFVLLLILLKIFR